MAKYRVVGTRPVAGVQPGGVVTFVDDSTVNVAALVAAGHIEEDKPKRTAKSTAEPPVEYDLKGDS